MINISVPVGIDSSIFQTLVETLRRAVDGTVTPILVDYTNQRVLVGATAASAAPAKMELTGGNFKIVTAGDGVILPNSTATNYYLLSITEVTNDDGTVNPTLTLTKQ